MQRLLPVHPPHTTWALRPLGPVTPLALSGAGTDLLRCRLFLAGAPIPLGRDTRYLFENSREIALIGEPDPSRDLGDDELTRNDFRVSEACEKAFRELTAIYHAERAAAYVAPPTREALQANRPI